jgi:site-specific recombinase XerD
MQMSKLVIHFESSPLDLSVDQMEEYLFIVHQNEKPSLSSFKHLVYGLRTLFVMYGREKLLLHLPSISKEKTLPSVLSKPEIIRLLKLPNLLKHRVILAVGYDCGLRISEIINLKISDVDFDRKRVHIRQSKCKKDRYVPISHHTLRGINDYIETSNPRVWLFNGKIRGEKMSVEGIRFIMRQACIKADITKKVCVHTLRHSYATHLLEMGLDIVTLQHQMGHTDIRATMIYLHVVISNPTAGFSPMEKLY